MKLNELRKVIREEVKAAIQEELKDILLEAVRSPKPAITENLSVAAPQTKPDPEAQKAFRQQMLSQMAAGNGNMNLTTADTNTFRPAGPATAEGSALPEGNVGLDQIMGLMTNK
jgi:hypothetical protein